MRLAIKRLAIDTARRGGSTGSPPIQASLEDEVRASLQLHTFAGEDRSLQQSRIELATAIATVATNGISLADAETIWALGNNNHNQTLRFEARPDLAPLHIEEADAFNRFLSGKILSAPKEEGKAKAIHYLGVHHHNMVSMIGNRARQRSKHGEA